MNMQVSMMTFNIIDYFLLVILVLCALNGLRHGFVLAAGSIMSALAGIALALLCYDNLALYLEQHLGIISSLALFLREKTPMVALSVPYGMLVPGFRFEDTIQYLAYWLVGAIAFFGILFAVGMLLRQVFRWLESLFSMGMASGMNQTLGIILSVLQGAVVIGILIGFSFPAIDMASAMGFPGARILMEFLNASVLVQWLLPLFDQAQAFLTIYA